jgi:23S rRNA (pseudouridine1915-N3)-methyltransferase
MRLRILAVGTKMPAWVEAGVDEYARRLRTHWKFELLEIPAGRRSASQSPDRAVASEGERVLAALRPGEQAIALDERGVAMGTRELAARLAAGERDGRDLALLIGGPDGHAPAVRQRATESWSMSKLTLPHGLARVLLAEQLYRAQSLLLNHPYHRD